MPADWLLNCNCKGLMIELSFMMRGQKDLHRKHLSEERFLFRAVFEDE